jgi:hypothetical protein
MHDELEVHSAYVTLDNSSLTFSSTRAAWRDLPRLLARRKLYMTGLPAECAPNVVDDEACDIRFVLHQLTCLPFLQGRSSDRAVSME